MPDMSPLVAMTLGHVYLQTEPYSLSSIMRINKGHFNKLRPWFFYYSFYGSADRLFWGFGKKIKLLLHTFFILADSRS